jgi:hypothetical protein
MPNHREHEASNNSIAGAAEAMVVRAVVELESHADGTLVAAHAADTDTDLARPDVGDVVPQAAVHKDQHQHAWHYPAPHEKPAVGLSSAPCAMFCSTS